MTGGTCLDFEEMLLHQDLALLLDCWPRTVTCASEKRVQLCNALQVNPSRATAFEADRSEPEKYRRLPGTSPAGVDAPDTVSAVFMHAPECPTPPTANGLPGFRCVVKADCGEPRGAGVNLVRHRTRHLW